MVDEDLLGLGKILARFIAISDRDTFFWHDREVGRLVLDGSLWDLSDDEKRLIDRAKKELLQED